MSAPAIWVSARQQTEKAANRGQYKQKIGLNKLQSSSHELLTLNSRYGGGYADHP